MAWVVAVNPAAGARPVAMDGLRRTLEEVGVEATIETPPDIPAMRRLIAEAVSVPRLAVVGGDGTVNLAVNSLFETGVSKFPVLGVLPAGSGCDLLRTFGIPNDLARAAAHLATDTVYPIDVGELSGSWGVRRFVNVAQAGVGAAAAYTALRLPRRLGSSRYVMAFGIRLPRFPRTEV
ncbi:MAG: diacylglycerol kinase family protein, partial [Acidimicrobiia bacterium]